MTYSDFFDVTIGVKQGEPLSPLLFILFINDIKNCIDFENLTEKDLNLLSVFMLLFADDIAIFTTSPDSLQSQLNAIQHYSGKWGLKINVNKTKICIFERKKSACNFRWYINQDPVEIVDEFCYLGIKFHYTGNLTKAVHALNEQALKAFNQLLSVFNKIELDIKTKLSLFDALVAPIILYGSEIWGIYDIKEVDKLNYKFCKIILGVRPQTSNAAVLGELGRFPLSVISSMRALKYWTKVSLSTDTLMNKLYDQQCAMFNLFNIQNVKKNSWCSSIKLFLNNLGYGYLFNDITAINTRTYTMLEQRIKDQYVQQWHDMVSNQPKLEYFNMFKCEFKYEKYLNAIENNIFRKHLTRFRLCSHSLEIETGRYNNIARNDRKCKMCSQNIVESEYHFLLCCPAYSAIRRKYNISTNWPNLSKFRSILSNQNVVNINNIARFISESMKLREETLNITDIT